MSTKFDILTMLNAGPSVLCSVGKLNKEALGDFSVLSQIVARSIILSSWRSGNQTQNGQPAWAETLCGDHLGELDESDSLFFIQDE